MPKKKTDETVDEAVTTCAAVPTVKVLEAEIIRLGLGLCDDIDHGIIRKEAANIEAVTNLYKAIKGLT